MMKNITYTKLFIILFLIFTIFYPILMLILNVEWSTFGLLLVSDQFKTSLANSLLTTTIATIISISLAYLLAYSINRTNIKHKAVLSVLFTLPMIVPSISHGLGLINLFGNNGIITKFLNVNFNIMGFNGIIFGSVLYSFPVAFLILSDSFKYIDNSMYENAEILGLSKFKTFCKITLYYLKRPLLSAIFAVFTLIITDYGLALVVGGKYMTLSVFLYKEVIGLLDFSKGAMIGTMLLIPAFISFIFDLTNKELGNSSFTNKKFNIKNNKIRDRFFNIVTILVILFLLILLGSFLYLAFIEKFPYNMNFSLVHFKYLIDNGILRFLKNSIIIAVLTSIVGTIVSYITAYITSRVGGKAAKIIHILAIVSIAIPGIVLGLTYVMAFKNSFIYQTFLILIIVNIIHFFASPYLMAYNALGKLNHDFETVGTTCGINRLRIIKDVIVPNSIETILEMFSYFFVNTMTTISAVSFLFSTETMPLSLLINQYDNQMMYEEAAIVSLTILAVNFSIKSIVYLIRRKIYNRSDNYANN